MRIISRSILVKFWEKHKESEHSLKTWFHEVKNAKWGSPNELKDQYASASVLNNRRVVFNIKGNKYRLIADIEYRIGIVFIIWIGTHKQYDEIDAKEIKYDKSN